MRRVAQVMAVVGSWLLFVGLRPRAQSFDALSFVLGAWNGTVDLGHALFLPLLRLTALGGEADSALRCAAGLSALGASLAFALLIRRIEHGGASPGVAWALAGCLAGGTLFFQEAGSIEPTGWTMAFLLAAAEVCDCYAARPTLGRLALACAAFAAALSFHVVSVLALPWLVRLAWRAEPRAPAAHLAVLGGFLLAGIGLAFGLRGALAPAWRYWLGFVPDYAEGFGIELLRHFQRGGSLVGRGAPLLLGLVLRAAWRMRTRLTRGASDALLLGAPYLLAFVVFGKPLVGLLMPVLLALTLFAASAPAARHEVRWILGASVLQLVLTAPQALEWSRAEDEPREKAARIARYVPEGAALFAGTLANHFRFYCPGLAVVSLPEIWHRVHALDRGIDPIAVLERAIAAEKRPSVLSSDGAGFMQVTLGADLQRMGLNAGKAFFIPEDSRLELYPLTFPYVGK